jgi:pre-mRNA-processing factor SLU7
VCRYEEDVLINNHTAVWGSWWSDGTWGYACCRSCVKNSYCTGKAGEKAITDSSAQMVKNLEAKAARAAEEAEARAKSTLNNKHLEKGDAVWGDSAGAADDEELDPEKVKAALKKLEKEQREAEAAGGDERKRKFNSVAEAEGEDGGSVSKEEMEAFRLMKKRAQDPAAAFTGNGSGTDGYDML